MRFVRVAITVLVATLACNQASSQSLPFKVEIAIPSEVIAVTTPCEVEIVVTNQSQTSYRVPAAAAEDWHHGTWVIIDPSGENCGAGDVSVEINCPIEETVILRPGESFSVSERVAFWREGTWRIAYFYAVPLWSPFDDMIGGHAFSDTMEITVGAVGAGE